MIVYRIEKRHWTRPLQTQFLAFVGSLRRIFNRREEKLFRLAVCVASPRRFLNNLRDVLLVTPSTAIKLKSASQPARSLDSSSVE